MRHRRLLQALILIAALGATAAPAGAKDREFSLISDCIKQQYKGKQRHSLLLKLASFPLRFAHPAGLRKIKLAVFEDLDPAGETGRPELGATLREGLGRDWRPVVQRYSRLSGEQTYIYSRGAGESVELLIVTIGENEATVLKAKIDPRKFLPMIADQSASAARGDDGFGFSTRVR
jgi:hypothetical protein